MRCVRPIVTAVLLATTTGCASFLMVKGPEPEGHPNREASTALCTTGKGWVVFDGVLGGIYALSGIAAITDPDRWEEETGLNPNGSALVYGGLTAVAVTSALQGRRKVDDCRAAKLQALEDARARVQARRAMERNPTPGPGIKRGPGIR